MLSALSVPRHPDVRLRELIREYGQLLSMTNAQARGQQFNKFLADLFAVWGVEARPNQKGLGGRDETDVVLAIDNKFYVLEAKWESGKIDIEPVSKLETRLKVRPQGTGGILVSMSGFTQHVHDYNEYQPEIMLLDKSHVEAMLAGLIGAK